MQLIDLENWDPDGNLYLLEFGKTVVQRQPGRCPSRSIIFKSWQLGSW